MLTTVLFVPDVRVCERGDDILSRPMPTAHILREDYTKVFVCDVNRRQILEFRIFYFAV